MRTSAFCLNHDPERIAEQRRRSARGGRLGGRGRPSGELARLQAEFETLAGEVRRGQVDKSVAAVMCQLLQGARACVRDRIHAREQEELAARMEQIEEALKQRRDLRSAT
jgi:hypothetical protein